MFQVFTKNLKPAVPQVLEKLGSGFEPVMKQMMSVFEESYLEKGGGGVAGLCHAL